MSRSLEDVFAELDAELEAEGPVRRWVRKRFEMHGYHGLYALRHPLKMARYTARDIRWFFHRGHRGYAMSDTWSLDGYLLSWLPDAIRDLREGSHGHPVNITSDMWDIILVEIEDGLRAGVRYEDVGGPGWGDPELLAQFEKSWKLMGEWFFHLWN